MITKLDAFNEPQTFRAAIHGTGSTAAAITNLYLQGAKKLFLMYACTMSIRT